MQERDHINLRDSLERIKPGSGIELSINLSNVSGTTHRLRCFKLLRCLPKKRIACLAVWKERPVFAKIFMDRKRARTHFRREQKGVFVLMETGITTPLILDNGEVPGAGIFILLFEYIVSGQGGQQCWRSGSEDERFRLMRMLTGVVAGHHEAGILQRDLHLDNFLLEGDKIFTLDGASIDYRRRAIKRNQALENLALLMAQLPSDYDRWMDRILREYSQVRGWPESPHHLLLLEKAVRRWRGRRKSWVLEKIFRECSDFVCNKSWRIYFVFDRSYDSPALRTLLSDPDAGFAGAEYLKRGNSSTVVRVRVNGLDLIIKRYNIKNLRHALNRSFRPTRAAVSWRNAHRLGLNDIGSPRPVALVEKRCGPLRREAYFITEHVDGMDCLALFDTNAINLRQKEHIAKNITETLKRLWLSKMSHGDMKGTNILIHKERVMLIDLDAMKQHRYACRAARGSRRDVKRFMKNWSGDEQLHALFSRYLESYGVK